MNPSKSGLCSRDEPEDPGMSGKDNKNEGEKWKEKRRGKQKGAVELVPAEHWPRGVGNLFSSPIHYEINSNAKKAGPLPQI